MPDGDGLAAKSGIVPLLNRRIEGIRVDMDDLARSAIFGGGWFNQCCALRT